MMHITKILLHHKKGIVIKMKSKLITLATATVFCMSLVACSNKTDDESLIVPSESSTIATEAVTEATTESVTETTTAPTEPTYTVDEIIDKINDNIKLCKQYHVNTKMKLRNDIKVSVDNGSPVVNYLELNTVVDTYVIPDYRHSTTELKYFDDNSLDPITENRSSYYVAATNKMYLNIQNEDTWYEKDATAEDIESVSYDFSKFFGDKSHFDNATVIMNNDKTYTITVPINDMKELSNVIAEDIPEFNLTANLIVSVDEYFCPTEFKLTDVKTDASNIVDEIYAQWSEELNKDNNDSNIEINPNIDANITFELITTIDSWNCVAEKMARIEDDFITNSVPYPVDGTSALGDTVVTTTSTESEPADS